MGILLVDDVTDSLPSTKLYKEVTPHEFETESDHRTIEDVEDLVAGFGEIRWDDSSRVYCTRNSDACDFALSSFVPARVCVVTP
ncbi:hypothetical protein EJ110_NYTH59180 [Nymphaea thermarum]|nr:hypothetical protein EJ110_NYTH59180 [Nymphaea thermarum]